MCGTSVSTERLGGVAAVLMGVLGGAFVALTALASPEAYDAGVISWPYVLSDYALALSGLLGLAAIPAISERVSHLSAGWVRWTASVAKLGFALLAVLNFWQAEYEMLSEYPAFAVPAVSYETNMELVLGGEFNAFIDNFLSRAPHGWLEVAGTGLWILTVSWLALQSGALPTGLAGAGIAAGFLAICTAAGANLNQSDLHVFGVIGGAVVSPLWFAWTGVYLLGSERPAFADAGQPVSASAPAPENWVVERKDVAVRRRRKHHLIRLWPN